MDTTECKTCTGCSTVKPLSEFHSDGRGGHLGRCRACRSTTRKAWRDTYRDRQSVYRRRFQLSRYGLTEDEYDAMLTAQDGGCAMCGNACQTGRQLAVDHDHASGRVRGLLCVKCNQALGVYEAIRAAASAYLTVYGEGNPDISHGAALAEKRATRRAGASVGSARLSDGDVRMIRARYAAGGVTQRALAREYGISQHAIGRVLRRMTWGHVEDLPAEAMPQGSREFVPPRPVDRLIQRVRRLTDDQIAEVRQLHDAGMSYRTIAARCNVHHTTIMRLVNGKHWKDVAA